MNIVMVKIELEDGGTARVEQRVSDAEFSRLTSPDIDRDTEFAFFYRAVRELGIESSQIRSFAVNMRAGKLGFIHPPQISVPVIEEPAPARGKVERCHSILRLANFVLPPRSRDEALDEWIDEIECAAAEKKPVVRRTLSIVFRALPSLALRARLPARARRKGGT
jgi:hypothetical protein